MATLGVAGSTYLITLLGNMGLQLSVDKDLKGDDLIYKTGNSTLFYNDLLESMTYFQNEYIPVTPETDYKETKQILRTHENFVQHVIDCFVKAKIGAGIDLPKDDARVFQDWVQSVLVGAVEFNSEIKGQDMNIKSMKELCDRYNYNYEYMITNHTYPWFYLSIILKMITDGVPVIGVVKEPGKKEGSYNPYYLDSINKQLSFIYPIEDITETTTYSINDFPFPDGKKVSPNHTFGNELTIPTPKKGGATVFYNSIDFSIDGNNLKVKLDNKSVYPKSAYTLFENVISGATANSASEMNEAFYTNIPDAANGNNDLTTISSYILYTGNTYINWNSPFGEYYRAYIASTQGDSSFSAIYVRPAMNRKLDGTNNPVIALNETKDDADWIITTTPAIIGGPVFKLTLNIVNEKLADLIKNGSMEVITGGGDGIHFDVPSVDDIANTVDDVNNGKNNWNDGTNGIISIGDKNTGAVVDGEGNQTNTTIQDKKDQLDKENPTTPTTPEPGGIASSDMITMYVVGTGTLRSLASKLWSKDFIDAIYKMYADPIGAIISLHAVPSFLAYGAGWSGIEDIKIGNYKTGIPANIVTAQYSESYYYMNETPTENLVPYWLNYEPYSTYQIYLPFCGFQNISSEIAFNVAKIKYTMDYLTGDLAITLMTNQNTVLAVFDGNCAVYTPVTGDNYGRFYTQAIGTAVGLATNPTAGGVLQAGASVLSSLDGAGSIKMGGSVSGNKGFLGPGNIFIVKHYSDRIGDISAFSELQKTGGVQYGQVSTIGMGNDGDFIKASSVYMDGIGGTESEKKELEQLLMEGVYY